MSKKSNIYVIVLFLLVFILAFSISSRHSRVEIFYPEHDTLLSDKDYQINTGNGILNIGQSTWDEIQAIYPQGKNLGMSTVFRPDGEDCLLTCSKKENILIRIHIDGNNLSSFRSIKNGCSFDDVEKQYGKYYTCVKKVDNKKDFDMIYGKNRNNSIVFHIRNDVVNRIIIQREVN